MTVMLSDMPLAVKMRLPSGLAVMPQGRRPICSAISAMISPVEVSIT